MEESDEVAELRAAAKLLLELAVSSGSASAAESVRTLRLAAPATPVLADSARGVESKESNADLDLASASAARRTSKQRSDNTPRDAEPVVAPKQGSDCTPRDATAETTPEEVEAPSEAAPAHEADASAYPRRWRRLRGLAASRSSSKPPERTERPTVER